MKPYKTVEELQETIDRQRLEISELSEKVNEHESVELIDKYHLFKKEASEYLITEVYKLADITGAYPKRITFEISDYKTAFNRYGGGSKLFIKNVIVE